MNTALAYIATLVVMPFIQAAALLLGSPLFFRLKKIDSDILYFIHGVMVSGVGTFCCVAGGRHLFGLFSVPFTITPVIVMAVATLAHDVGRIYRVRNSPRSVMEGGYAVGDVAGFILGLLFFVFQQSWTLILGIAVVPVAFFVYGLIVARSKSFDFWNLASRYPDEAYDWFQDDACWLIYDPPSGRASKPDATIYNGSFPLYIPKLGRLVSVYGRFDMIEESQRRFVERHTPQ